MTAVKQKYSEEHYFPDTYNIRVPSNGCDPTAASAHLSEIAHASHASTTSSRIRQCEHLAFRLEVPDDRESCG